jgi:hypothetical protein
MKELILDQLHSLSGTFRVLHGRVRQAVAGEVGKAVSEAVGEVLTTVLGGGLVRVPRFTPRPSAYGRTEWNGTDARRWDEEYAYQDIDREPDDEEDSERGGVSAEAALALAWSAGRWWFGRRGSSWSAAGVGLAAGLALMTGGPVTKTTLGLLWAVSRLLKATDALGDGAKALDRV